VDIYFICKPPEEDGFPQVVFWWRKGLINVLLNGIYSSRKNVLRN